MSDSVPQNLIQCAFDFDALANLPAESPFTVHTGQIQQKRCCCKCKKIKPLDDFYNDVISGGKKIKQYNCKICDKLRKRQSRKDNPLMHRNKRIRKVYNLEPDEYDAKLKAQNNVCDICGKSETAIDYRTNKVMYLSIDHNHKTGKIRGLLCHGCNKKLGLIEKRIEKYSEFIDYLGRHRG